MTTMAAATARPWNRAFWELDPPPRHVTPERQAQAWRHVVVNNATGEMEQHLVRNGVDTLAKLARTADAQNDFIEFVVQPFLEVEGVTGATVVEWKSDMLIRVWRLARRHERLRRHDSNVLNPAGRSGHPPDPVAASKKTPFVGTARVVHRIADTTSDEPRRTLPLRPG